MAAPVLAAVGDDPVTVTSNGRIKARRACRSAPGNFTTRSAVAFLKEEMPQAPHEACDVIGAFDLDGT